MKTLRYCAAALIALAGCNHEPEPPPLVLLPIDSAAYWRAAVKSHRLRIDKPGVAARELASSIRAAPPGPSRYRSIEFSKFDGGPKREDRSLSLFWPDELEAIVRLRSLK